MTDKPTEAERTMRDQRTSSATHELHIVIGEGFRHHTVVVAVDDREVYRRCGVTTDPATSLADVVALRVASPMARVSLSAAPGGLVGSMDLDVTRHQHLIISLVGDGTVGFEMGWSSTGQD